VRIALKKRFLKNAQTRSELYLGKKHVYYMDKLGISLLSMKSKNFHTILSVLKKMFEILLLKLNSVSF